MIYITLFLEFAKIGLVCVGGGYASMPLIQDCVVKTYHWLRLAEFIDIFTISQMTPGPIGINAATFAGTKIAGFFGAVSATSGFVAPSVIICLVVAKILERCGSIGVIRGALNGLRPAVTALIVSAGLSFIALAVFNTDEFPKSLAAMKESFDPKSALILALAILAVRKKVDVVKVLIGSGVLGATLVFWR